MSATVGNASQNLGGTIEDISDRDTAEILSGKVENAPIPARCWAT